LSPSVKAGGYGTAGWSIGGDIIIDVSKLIEVDIEAPKDDGSFTSLREVAPANSKGKKSQSASSGINSGKRRREEDANLRVYDSASHAVASFLRGPSSPAPGHWAGQAMSTDTFNGPSPSIRRRPEGPESPRALSYTTSSPLAQNSSASSDSGFNSREQSISTLGTTPSPPPPNFDAIIRTSSAVRPGNNNGSSNDTQAGGRPDSRNGSANSNPFAYLESPNNFPPTPPPISLESHYNPSSVTTSYFSGSSSSFATDPFGQMQMQTQAEPIHPHAFVTFGAGMRQKEIDIFTAQHKLEATGRYLTGNGDGIPYHVPL
jgi:hypothetical protein